MRKSKKLLVTIVFLTVFIIANSILNFTLVPPGLTRIILHELESNNDYKCVILGTSHGSYGIDPDIVSQQLGKKTINLCIGGEYLKDSYYLLKRTYETNTPELIVLDVDFQYLINVPKNSVSANFIYNAYPNTIDKVSYFKNKILKMEYRATLFPWMDYRDNYSNVINIAKTKLGSDYNNYSAKAVNMYKQDVYHGRGFVYRNHLDSSKTDKMSNMIWNVSKVDQESIKYLKKIIDLCDSNNTKIIMITTPISVDTIKHSLNEFDKSYTYLSNLAEANNIDYYNFSLVKESVFSRSLDDYWDYDGHMYGDAAQRFSLVLGKLLKESEVGKVEISNYLYDSVRNIQ
ncbi:hypothetical protein [[Clostridium] fimetarium]|uniref:SGNH/GDSL hydrolase family protein n=1 Tax=[Clostridium] fimetarium TaxID=99656 RepID=A0A1I0R1E6_9FIRM|nr:hypothetical protein [[Clostridium] fimetarium]SEW34295.1 hypothetical protein SAMN05421659_11141 [[Clostridium] fimetarium]